MQYTIHKGTIKLLVASGPISNIQAAHKLLPKDQMLIQQPSTTNTSLLIYATKIPSSDLFPFGFLDLGRNCLYAHYMPYSISEHSEHNSALFSPSVCFARFKEEIKRLKKFARNTQKLKLKESRQLGSGRSRVASAWIKPGHSGPYQPVNGQFRDLDPL